MLFPTLFFGLFFLALYALVWGVGRHNEWRKIILLVGSWIFYGAWDWRFVPLLMASALLNFSAAWIIGGSRPGALRRWTLVLGVIANLGILATFKYYGFFIDQAAAVLRLLHWQRDLPLLQIILPVGVSFFTFQGMSYLIDVHRGRCARASLMDVTLLMSFFAHLVAGPIVRGSDLIPQFAVAPRLDRKLATGGLILIVWGLFKKTVIASQLATGLIDPVFFDPSAHGVVDLAAAAYGYAVQIYCDFSAYSDMAIGLAALLGYRFPRNFDQPYRATSLQDFWRRWHISLSSWLRDYLFIPLGGSRGGMAFVCRNLMITMLLGGLWHGAAWTFVIWGALHGAVLCLERLGGALKPRDWPNVPKLIGLLITFHVVCLGWIFFRSESFAGAVAFLGGFVHPGDGPMIFTPLALALILMGLAIHAAPPRLLDSLATRAARLPMPAMAAGLAATVLLVDAMRPQGIAPFIYFQF
jgi:alginate O-acetyltransferase complex protein AlgI